MEDLKEKVVFVQKNNPEPTFTYWGYTEELKIKPSKVKLIHYLEESGFRTIEGNRNQFARVVDNIITESSKEEVRAFVLDSIDLLPTILKKFAYKEVTKDDLKEVMLGKLNSFLGIEMLSTLKPQRVKLQKDPKDKSLLYYRNGVVSVTADNIWMADYLDLKEAIWDKQMIGRNYTQRSYIKGESEFYKFCFNLCKKDERRLSCLMRMLGKLIHTYKDPANALIAIFTDETISENSQAEGGVGKSLLVTCLTYMRHVTMIDGRTVKFNDKFFTSALEPHTMLVRFEDLSPKCNMDDMIQMITGVTQVRKLHKNVKVLSFEESPQFLITCNYLPMGSGGNTEERRKWVFEVGSHYHENWKPEMEFGHKLFNDWDSNEWTLFDAFMIECVQKYLKEGIEKPEPINIVFKSIVQKTNLDFYYWFHPKVTEHQKEFIKADELKSFQKSHPDYKNLTQREFSAWMFSYFSFSKINYRQESIGPVTRAKIVID